MAMDVSKQEDKKEDISFLQKKRTPKMKPKSEVQSPFSAVENLGREKASLDLNKKESSKSEKIKSVKSKKNIDIFDFPDITIASRDIKLILSAVGSSKAMYIILLLGKSKDGHLRISHTECAELFQLKSQKQAKSIMSSLEKEGMIEKVENPDLKNGVSTLYKVKFLNSLN